MHMCRFIFIFSVVIFCINSLFAQKKQLGESSYSVKSKQREELLLNKANKGIIYKEYNEAVSNYSELLKIDSASFTANYGMAVSLYSNFQQPASILFFERALRHSKDTAIEAYFFLANSYHLSGKYDKAEQYYKQYLLFIESHPSFLPKDEFTGAKSDVLHRIKMCENGKRVSTTKSPLLNDKTGKKITITYIGDKINSQYDDYGAVFSTNDSLLFYTSKRSGQGDVYVSRFENNKLSPGNNIESPINTNSYEAIVNISADGKRVYVYRSGIDDGTIYFSDNLGDRWSIPLPLLNKNEVKTTFKDARIYSFAINQNKDELFIVSDRIGGLGGKDIYVSKKMSDSTWGALENIGAHINSQYDEVSLSLSRDGNTMYFSSNGDESIGGFDVFVIYKKDGRWSEPLSLGTPINTPGDDLFFSFLNQSNRASYSSSVFSNKQTRDLNMLLVDFCDDVKGNTIKGIALGFSEGTITFTNDFTGANAGKCTIKNGKYSHNLNVGTRYLAVYEIDGIKPVQTLITIPEANECKRYDIYQELVLKKAGDTLKIKNALLDADYQANNPTANYPILLEKQDKTKLKNYNEINVLTFPETSKTIISTVVYDSISGKALSKVAIDNSLFDSDKNKIKEAYDQTMKSATMSSNTKTITSFSFANTLFDFNKSTIKPEYKTELDKAVRFLLEVKPDSKIEIAGYTDSKGNENYNLALSKKRANAIARYLISKKINKSRITTIGLGATKPVASNTNTDGTDNKPGRAQNRRTEIIIK